MQRAFRWSVSILAVFLVAILVAGIGIYQFHYQSRFTIIMQAIIPYPALLVNGEFLTVRDYIRERQFASDFVNFQQQRLTGQTLSAEEEKQFLASLPEYIQNRLLWKQMAMQQQVTVTSQDIDALLESALLDLGGQETLNAFLSQHGYTLETFKQNLIEPTAYREGIVEALWKAQGSQESADATAQKNQLFLSAYQDFRARSYIRSFYFE